jgi:glucose dehydrogenase
MKKNVILLLVGMVLVIIGAFLKISHSGFSTYFFIAGLALEAYTLGSLVIQSLKKVK